MEWVTIDESVGTEQELNWLCIGATTTYGVGDVVTTIALVYFAPETQEANPVINAALDTLGLAGLFGLKLAVFFFCITRSKRERNTRLERPLSLSLSAFPPLLLAILGTILAVLNIRLIAA